MPSFLVYVSPNGLLTYTIPHLAAKSAGSVTTGLNVLSTTQQLNPFYKYWLCNTDTNASVWRVWLEYRDAQGSIVNNGKTKKNACTLISLLAEKYSGTSAWEYD